MVENEYFQKFIEIQIVICPHGSEVHTICSDH